MSIKKRPLLELEIQIILMEQFKQNNMFPRTANDVTEFSETASKRILEKVKQSLEGY